MEILTIYFPFKNKSKFDGLKSFILVICAIFPHNVTFEAFGYQDNKSNATIP